MRFARRLPRRRVLAAAAFVALLGLLLLAAALFLLRRPAPAILPPPSRAPAVTLTLDAPDSIAAGDVLTVTVHAGLDASLALSGTAVLLTAEGVNGPWAGHALLSDGTATFALPSGWTQGAGVATLRAGIVGRDSIPAVADLTAAAAVTATVSIHPGPAANPLLTLTGPVSVRIDADAPPMLVTLPVDQHGNAALPVDGDGSGNGCAAEGCALDNDDGGDPSTGITVLVQHPSANGQAAPTDQYAAVEQGLLAVARLLTRHTAGLLTAAASTAVSTTSLDNPAFSPLQSVRVMPGIVVTPTVSAVPATVPAGGSAVVEISTGLLQDKYGNVLPDGTLVTFVLDGDDRRAGLQPAVVGDDRSGAFSEGPALPVTNMVAGREIAANKPTVNNNAAGAGEHGGLETRPTIAGPIRPADEDAPAKSSGGSIIRPKATAPATADSPAPANAATLPGSLPGTYAPDAPGTYMPTRIPATVVDGRASVMLAAPATAGVATLRALVGTVASAPVTITFTAPQAAPGFALVAEVRDNLLALRAGPARDDLGAYLPDGTAVTFTVTAPDGTTRTVAAGTRYGYAEVVLPLDGAEPGVYRATANLGDAHAAATFTVPRVWQ